MGMTAKANGNITQTYSVGFFSASSCADWHEFSSFPGVNTQW